MSGVQRNLKIQIKVGEAERVYDVKFPSVGDYINVESRKAQLAVPRTSLFDQSTQYLNLIRQGTISSNMALDLVDMTAWFEVCIPNLMKDTVGNIQSIEELDIMDAKPLLDAYKKQFLPWKTKWEEIFQGITKEESVEDKKE